MIRGIRIPEVRMTDISKRRLWVSLYATNPLNAGEDLPAPSTPTVGVEGRVDCQGDRRGGSPRWSHNWQPPGPMLVATTTSHWPHQGGKRQLGGSHPSPVPTDPGVTVSRPRLSSPVAGSAPDAISPAHQARKIGAVPSFRVDCHVYRKACGAAQGVSGSRSVAISMTPMSKWARRISMAMISASSRSSTIISTDPGPDLARSTIANCGTVTPV
jgi:hypothetical protein